MEELAHASLARQLMDALPVGVMIVRGGRILSINRTLAEWLNHPPQAFCGMGRADAEPLGLAFLFEESADLPLRTATGEKRLHRQRRGIGNGTEAHVFEDHTLLEAVRQERDRYRSRVEALEPMDRETGLLKRSAIIDALDRQVSRSRRYGNPLSVVRLSLGPSLGERLPQTLRDFSRQLRAELRWVDQIGRYGDSSLLLILPETREAVALKLAGRLGHDRAPSAEARTAGLEFRVTSWRTGDDTRKLLGRLDVPAADSGRFRSAAGQVLRTCHPCD